MNETGYTHPNYSIIPYNDSQQKHIEHICQRTFYGGSDFPDPQLISLRWALGYLLHCPDTCFTAVESSGLSVGYILCCTDTESYQEYYQNHIVSAVQDRLNLLKKSHLDYYMKFHESFLPKESDYSHPFLQSLLTSYPAHLHINLLSCARRQGLGAKLMKKLIDRLNEKQCKGIHLIVGRENKSAIAFYRKMGFSPLQAENTESIGGLVMVLRFQTDLKSKSISASSG